MSKVIELIDEHFRTVANVAAANGRSPREWLARLIMWRRIGGHDISKRPEAMRLSRRPK